MVTNRNDHDDFDEEESSTRPEIERSLSAVASLPGRNVALVIGLFIFVGVVIYYSFFSGTPAEKKAAEKEQVKSEISDKIETTKPVSAEPETTIAAAPSLPEPPPLVVPTPPPPPPAPTPALPAPSAVEKSSAPLPAFLEKEDPKVREAAEARRKSGIMLGGGGGGGASGAVKSIIGGKEKGGTGITDRNYKIGHTEAEQKGAGVIGDTGAIIAQGKIIDAILETAINTDLPGPIRAIVSRDVYAESGRNILIPKGSRLVGDYTATVKRGQQRVNITWDRVLRPDGIDVMIESPGTDQLGRAGVEGIVDNKYFELFRNSLLITTITTGAAIAADQLVDGGSTTTTTTADGDTSTTGSASSTAINNAVQTMGDVTRQILQESLQIQPTITVDQGTRVKVFVNRDLVFPTDVSNNVKVIQ